MIAFKTRRAHPRRS